tara:strand:+ start:2186 stop:3976 length:1791 start_codon:yes stop_codon:yes gene_type:complete
MAETFQPNLAPSAGGESFVQSGVVDKSTASFVQSAGQIGTELFKGSVLADLEGSEDNKDFVDPTEKQFGDITAETLVGELDLSTITAARKQKKLTGAGAAAKVNAKSKALIAAHPYFAQEIKAATSKFFAGTGLSGPMFTDKDPEESLIDTGIKSGVKAGWIDPTATREQQVIQLQAHSTVVRSKQNLGLLKLETDVSEQQKDVSAVAISRDYINGQGIAIEQDILNVMGDLKDLPVEQQVAALEQLRIDKDSEARRFLPVDRLGEDGYKAAFNAVIGNKIDLQKKLIQGSITQQVYETQNATIKALAENQFLNQPGVAEAVTLFGVLRNIPVGLIGGATQTHIATVMSQMTSLLPQIKAAKAGSPIGAPGSVPMRSTEEGKLFYGALMNSMGQRSSAAPDDKEAIDTEIGVMLSAHADGVGRYADTFDAKRWDQLATFFASPQSLKYIQENGEAFTPEARRGLNNAITFQYADSLLGSAKRQMEGTLASQLPTGAPQGRFSDAAIGTKPMIDFVTIEATGGEVRFVPKLGGTSVNSFTQRELLRRIESLNKNYASRINSFVKMSAHLKGSNNYNEVLQTTLEETGLIPKDESSDN